MRRLLLLAFLAWAVTASAQVPSYVPTDGLVAWYPFNGNVNDEFASLDGSGSPSAYTTGVSGISSSAAVFTGNQIVDLPSSFDFAERSFSAWIKPASWSWQLIFSVDHPELNHGLSLIGLGHPDNPTAIGLQLGGSNVRKPWFLNEWIHVAACRNQDSTWFYFNGELNSSAESDNLESVAGTSNARFGSDRFGGRKFNGTLDDVTVYNRVLTSEEIMALFNMQPAVTGCTDESACNYEESATIDDDSCIPSGCLEEGACNFNADAECEGEACDYSCCPGPGCCGDGMNWDADAQTCVITPPSVASDTECTLLNLQELAEGYQILLAENAELDSLLADCNGTSTSDPSGPCAGEDVFTYHGYDYDVVEIGDQCWFAENLRTSTFNNGLAIANASNDSEWSNATAAAYSVHPTSPAYGYYYNGHCMDSDHEVCPTGWHVPSDGDWIELEQFINLSNPESSCFRGTVATKLKATSEDATPWDGSNETGFTAVPSGYRYTNGLFHEQGNRVNLWTSTVISGHLVRRRMDTGNDGVNRDWNNCDPILMNHGFSVRCVKD